MSMLAEGRKKVKYSVNPRGTTWSNDEDKFGQKLMEKFGWQKGKGLGVNEDGRVEHVKASGKNNTKGFGFKRTDSNNWICHQDDFDSLLSELNANHGRRDQDDTEKVISLEEKSKAARKRVHYHKHAKGKDLSQRSSEDLDCIFGRKKSRQSQAKEPSPDVQDRNVASPTEETTHGIQTIQSNQSVQEYFAMKMAKLKVKKNSVGQQSCLSDALSKEEMEPDQCAEGLVLNETSVADTEAAGGDEENMEEKSKKKKKKKKSKEKERKKEEEDKDDRTEEKGKTDSDDDDDSGENCDGNLSKKTKKSKRKKRSKACLNDEVEETPQNVVKDGVSVAEDAEMVTGEKNSISKSSKKKLDKKNKVKISASDSNAVEDSKSLENSAVFEKDLQDFTNTDSVDMNSGISKKAMPSIDKETAMVENETMSKNKKSKRKKNEENDVDKSVTFDMANSNSNNSNVDDNNDEERSPPKKKKKSSKKSKSKSEESLDTQTADGSIDNETKVHIKKTNSAEAKTSSVTNSLQLPKDKYDVKRNMDAINTAAKKFQKVGANINTICGYGYTKE